MKEISYSNIEHIVRIIAKPMRASIEWYKIPAKKEVRFLGIRISKEKPEAWMNGLSWSSNTYTEDEINTMSSYIMHEGVVHNRAELFIGYTNSSYNQRKHFATNEECKTALYELLNVTDRYKLPILEDLIN